ncbi:MAG: CPP1-like family protein [Cyanobacteria bacterium P01_F01_bin.150]
MSEKKHYETLGLDENASFEEIQSARDRLLKKHNGDRKQSEAVETAYDAILMDRLRLRQEGKIKVPDRIRFPERPVEPTTPRLPLSTQQAPDWAQQFLDSPSQNEVLWPAIAFSCVALLALVSNPNNPSTANLPTLALTLGTGFCFYFLLRKENKFFRALGLTLVGLIVGVALGSLLYGLIVPPLVNLGAGSIASEGFDVIVTAVVLWVLSCFFR